MTSIYKRIAIKFRDISDPINNTPQFRIILSPIFIESDIDAKNEAMQWIMNIARRYGLTVNEIIWKKELDESPTSNG